STQAPQQVRSQRRHRPRCRHPALSAIPSWPSPHVPSPRSRSATYTSFTFVPVGPVSTSPPNSRKYVALSLFARYLMASSPASWPRGTVDGPTTAPAASAAPSSPSEARLAITHLSSGLSSIAAESAASVFLPPRPS